jgi:hypothetical protein
MRRHVQDTWPSMLRKENPNRNQKPEILKLSVSSLQNDDQVSSAFNKAMIQVAGDRDMAA